MAAEVEAVREARAEQLGGERKEAEGKGRKEALMTTRPLHVRIIRPFRGRPSSKRRGHRQNVTDVRTA